MNLEPCTFYLAGALFNARELCGNVALGEAIERLSAGEFRAVLPQDSESNSQRGQDIRDRDLEMVFDCDLIVANFDGAELDSGTVMEFAYAKMLDIPAVLLRTDFRHSGDQQPGSDPWNLMCSNYPRSRTLHLNGMQLYHQARVNTADWAERCRQLYDTVAARVVSELRAVRGESALDQGDLRRAELRYQLAAESCGPSFRRIFSDARIAETVAKKHRKNLI